jgi:hypothetical protein
MKPLKNVESVGPGEVVSPLRGLLVIMLWLFYWVSVLLVIVLVV